MADISYDWDTWEIGDSIEGTDGCIYLFEYLDGDPVLRFIKDPIVPSTPPDKEGDFTLLLEEAIGFRKVERRR